MPACMLTASAQAAIVERLALGASIDSACLLAGIHRSTHYAWMQRADKALKNVDGEEHACVRASERVYVDYSDAVKRAQEEAHLRNLAVIQEVAEGEVEYETQTFDTYYKDGTLKARKVVTKRRPPVWQAAAWFLERRYPELYARTVRHMQTGSDGRVVEPVAMTQEERDEVVRQNLERASHLLTAFTGEDDLI